MKVLITGGAGFIGSHLADHLLKRGDIVGVIDNYTTGSKRNIPTNVNLTLVEGNIVNRKLLEKMFEEFNPDFVVHAAASYKDPTNWFEDSQTNVAGTANVASLSKASGVKRLIYFQTSLCYGLKPQEQPITLSHPLRPQGSSYAISKTAAEHYIALSQIDYISFRLANAYGPRNLSGPLPTFYKRLISNEPCYIVDARRDFIFVKDLVEIVTMALDGKGERGAYHVSSGTDYPIKALFDTAVKVLEINLNGQEIKVQPRKPDDAPTILLDPSKTEKDFGWTVKTPLEAGVREAIQWYKEFGVKETYTHLKLEDRDGKQEIERTYTHL